MSIFRRLFKIGQAHAHKLVDDLEEPEIMLDQGIRDRERSIDEAKRKVQEIIAVERQSNGLIEEELAQHNNWEAKAKIALTASNEELATKALIRSEEHQQKADQLRPLAEQQRKEIEELKSMIRKMDAELMELKRSKDIIIAQSKAAEVKKNIYETKARIDTDKTMDLVDRMKAKAQRTSFEAEAAREIAQDLGNGSLEEEFKKLGSNKVSETVMEKLAQLKKEIAG